MRTSGELICLDESIPDAIVGCDPGPEYCAFALVTRQENKLTLARADYWPVSNMIFDTALCDKRLPVVFGFTRPFGFAFEKMTMRYGAIPGATTFDTCRNSGVALVAAALSGAKEAYGLGTSDWRVAFGGAVNIKDSEVRREIINLFGDEADKYLRERSNFAKAAYKLKDPATPHLRDAVGVAVGAFMMKRRGVSATARLVWRNPDAE